jgi:hypothetical protein
LRHKDYCLSPVEQLVAGVAKKLENLSNLPAVFVGTQNLKVNFEFLGGCLAAWGYLLSLNACT